MVKVRDRFVWVWMSYCEILAWGCEEVMMVGKATMEVKEVSLVWYAAEMQNWHEEYSEGLMQMWVGKVGDRYWTWVVVGRTGYW